MKELIVIGCAHSGSKAAKIADFKWWVKQARRKNTYLLCLGDMFENAIPGRGEGMVFEQRLTPQEQLDEMVEILKPVAHKIIGACGSNHSERTWKEVGLDMDKELYARIGCKEGVYQGAQGVVVFAGKKIAFAHGKNGGGEWGDALKLLRIYPDVDMICVSHKHKMTCDWHGHHLTRKDGSRKLKFVRLLRTGGLMNWARYAQLELYNPQKPGFSRAFFPPGETIRVDTNGR